MPDEWGFLLMMILLLQVSDLSVSLIGMGLLCHRLMAEGNGDLVLIVFRNFQGF